MEHINTAAMTSINLAERMLDLTCRMKLKLKLKLTVTL